MSEIRIILDLDDVLADFVGGVCNLYGVSREELDEVREEWEIVPALNELRRDDDPVVSKTNFWRRINAEKCFWFNLCHLPWCQDLVSIVKTITNDWHIVTAPSYDVSCYTGKVNWLKDMFGKTFKNFAITPHKEIFAQPGVILIDDRPTTVEKFRQHGGQAILFPSSGNDLFAFKDNPLPYIKNSLNKEIDNALDVQKC